VPIHIVFDGHIPMVRATIEGVPGMYYIDTGSRAELSLTKPFAERQHLRQTHPKGVVAIDGWGVGGPSRAFVTKGRSLKIGPFELHDVVTSFSTDKGGAFTSASYEGNIGSALLKRFVVTFDYAHELMYLKPLPGPVPDSGVFDRSGMWINADPAGFRVYDVTRTGPAEQAGLAKGDLIVAVDGRPAKELKLHELRRRLRDEAPGTVVTFAVIRDGSKPRQVKLTLRDLI
jgi:membrane-associated protease RseP (regulator of RpoE activity)